MKNIILLAFFVLLLPFNSIAQDGECSESFRSIRANASLTGKLKLNKRVNYYKVVLKRSGKLTASIRNMFFGIVEIRDGYCNKIPDRGTKQSRMATLAPGEWFIKAHSPRGQLGSYKLYVHFKPGEQVGNQKPIVGGESYSDFEGDEGQDDLCGPSKEVFIGASTRDRFKKGKKMEQFKFRIDLPTTLTVWTKGLANTKGELLDSTCETIKTASKGGKSKNFKLKADLHPGNYYVKVSHVNGRIKNYSLSLKGSPLAVSTLPLNLQLTGKWTWSRSGLSDSMGLPANTESGSVELAQSGKHVVLTFSGKQKLKGILKDNILSYVHSYKKGSVTKNEKINVIFMSNNEGKGYGSWKIKNNGQTGIGVYEYTLSR